MASFERQATITWEGTAREGRGEVRAVSGSFALSIALPYRVTPAAAAGHSSPEELLAAAHASCFAMALAAMLAHAGASVSRLHVSAT
ncbi:MAG TPA: OsmC family protein, partial [Methylomirabilota bacterium]